MVEQLDLFLESVKPSEDDLQAMFDKKNKQKKLTPRQWQLLRFITYASLTEHRKVSQRDIVNNVVGYEWNDEITAHDHCPSIWNDIKDINLSYETDKVIISKNFEYWIGSEEETKAFIDKLWNDLEARLIRYWAYLKKVRRNGQGLLLDRKGNTIDENSSARAWVESYGQERIEH